MRTLLVGAFLLSLGCTSGTFVDPCGACTANEVCVEVNNVVCAPACSQDAGTAKTDSGVCYKPTTCQEAVVQYCPEQPCTNMLTDVCL